jgi:hypothetical protein
MKKGTILVLGGALVFPTIAFAQTVATKVAPARDIRRPAPALDAWGGILRQDLFDRNNPNNLRSDWPSPPRQPGSF